MILQLVSNIGKILVLLFTDSLILIQLVYCLAALVQLFYLYVYAKRNYSWLDFNKKADYKAISQKNSVLVHQLSGMIFNNTDVLLPSLWSDAPLHSALGTGSDRSSLSELTTVRETSCFCRCWHQGRLGR